MKASALRVLLPAVLLSVLSSFLPREPALGWQGNLCGPPNSGQPCAVAVKQAGWPVAFVQDDPNLSAVGTLSFEDDWNVPGFLLNTVFYAGLLGLLLPLIRRRL